MKHVKAVSKVPRRAESMTTGGILSSISQLFAVIADFFLAKEGS